jgi:hypothetical protein
VDSTCTADARTDSLSASRSHSLAGGVMGSCGIASKTGGMAAGRDGDSGVSWPHTRVATRGDGTAVGHSM